jgi:hypothetical protein
MNVDNIFCVLERSASRWQIKRTFVIELDHCCTDSKRFVCMAGGFTLKLSMRNGLLKDSPETYYLNHDLLLITLLVKQAIANTVLLKVCALCTGAGL